MQLNRGILYLQDPLNHQSSNSIIMHEQGLVFTENEPLLYQAQAALQQAHREHEWLCVCARGSAVYIALALAAQLPVDRLALISPTRNASVLNREMQRMRSYARRNLALITAEILLWDAEENLIRSLLRGNQHSRLCLPDTFSPELFTCPWETLVENNLLIRGKCV